MNTNTSSASVCKAPSVTNSVREIQKLHQDILGAAITSFQKATRIGELLADIKDKLPHGEWLPWLAANVEFSQQTASNYARIFRERDRLKLLTVSNLTDAYRLLSSPAQPEQATKPDSAPSAAIILQPADFQRFERLSHDDRLVVETTLGIFAQRGQAVTPDDVVGLIGHLEHLARN